MIQLPILSAIWWSSWVRNERLQTEKGESEYESVKKWFEEEER